VGLSKRLLLDCQQGGDQIIRTPFLGNCRGMLTSDGYAWCTLDDATHCWMHRALKTALRIVEQLYRIERQARDAGRQHSPLSPLS
jgi:hypothetical protein